jgi:hypothetical protein
MADRYNPFSVYSDGKTPYQDIFNSKEQAYGQAAMGGSYNGQPPAENGGVGNQITAGLGFADSLFGEGGSLNPEDIILQKENRIDSENPYLDSSTYNRNMEASDVKTAKSKAKGAALKSMGTGAALGTAIMPGIGTAVGAIVGGAAGLIGIGSATNKAKKAKKEATAARKKTIKQYNNAMYAVGEQDAAEQRASMYKNNTFNTNLMSLV